MQLFGQAGRYLLTGGMAAIVDIGGFWLATTLGAPVLPAAVLSFTLAAVANYMLTSTFVFQQAPSLARFGLFFAFAVVGLTINASVTIATAQQGSPPVVAKIAGVGCAFIANFALNAFIVFRLKPR